MVRKDTPRRQSINHQSSFVGKCHGSAVSCYRVSWSKAWLNTKKAFAAFLSSAWSQAWSCPLLQVSIALSGSAAQEAHGEFQATAKFQACAGHAARFYQPPLMGILPPSKLLNPSFMLQTCNASPLEHYSISNPAIFFFAFLRRIKWVKGMFWAWWTAVAGSGNTVSITVSRREQSTERINRRSFQAFNFALSVHSIQHSNMFFKKKIKQIYFKRVDTEVIISQSFGRESRVSFFREL